MGTLRIADVTHERLREYRDEYGHTSFDSAIRELLSKHDRCEVSEDD